jgi:molecular chaperone GrpE
MPDQTIDNTLNDAALESVTAETQARPAKNASPSDQKIADLEAQLREANERALRTHAELENYRKRMQREMADERKYAVVPLVRDLLPVIDNLERAIEHAQARSASEGSTAGEVASLLEGVKLVAQQFETVLKQYQCERIPAVGETFDPNLHQALAQEPSNEYPAGTVSRAYQAGYKLEGRVIRPAQVFVSTGPANN